MPTAATSASEFQFLTVPEIARRLRVHESTVYRAVSSRALPAVRLTEHGAIRIPSAALDEFVRRQSEHPAERRGPEFEPAVEPRRHGGGEREGAA